MPERINHMDHYINIILRPDPEVNVQQLMSVLFEKIHHALVDLKSTKIGVSFPHAAANKAHLGDCLRLHGNQNDLNVLLKARGLTSFRDHLNVTEPCLVPISAQHCIVKRVQVKSSPERLRKRLMRRHNIDLSQAIERIPDKIAQVTKLPYISFSSQSTGQTFRLFINQSKPQTEQIIGEFNTFGLSQLATVPWFQ